MADALFDEFRDLVLSEAAIQARRLARLLRLAADHVDDLEQELLLDLIERLPAYDRERACPATFVSLVAVNKAYRLLERHQLQRRRWGNPVSLDDLEAASCDPAATRKHPDQLAETDPIDAVELRLDLASVLRDLPTRLRELCRHLGEAPLTEISRATGRGRSSLYRDIAQLRATVLLAGLHPHGRPRWDTFGIAGVSSP